MRFVSFVSKLDVGIQHDVSTGSLLRTVHPAEKFVVSSNSSPSLSVPDIEANTLARSSVPSTLVTAATTVSATCPSSKGKDKEDASESSSFLHFLCLIRVPS